MSFAQETKAGLVSLSDGIKHDCCRRAGLYGIVYSAGIFSRERLKLVTACEELAELAVKWLHDRYQICANLYVTERKSNDSDERRSCKITVPQKKEMARLFHGFRYSESDAEYQFKREMLHCDGCLPAFVRGVFLSAGTVTDPDKSYHLELNFTSAEVSHSIAELLCECGLEPKRTSRKNENVLYYKDSESIENFLVFIGATGAAFSLMNKKIERELRSGANRIANSELANIGKTIAAAGDQIAAINDLKMSGELDRIPDELRITAHLRLEHPDATLSQLAALHDPPITKSGVNHRLKKLEQLSAGTRTVKDS